MRIVDKGMGVGLIWPGGNRGSLGHFYPHPNEGQKANE